MNRSRSAGPSPGTVRGFSYLWTLMLIALLGLGMAAVAEVDTTQAQREKERELLAVGRQFRTAIGRYYESRPANGKREYPASLQDLLKDHRSPATVRHLRRIFVDPMTGKAEWGEVRIGGRLAGVHSLSQKTPIKQGGFEPEDAAFAGAPAVSAWVFTYPSNLSVQPAAGLGTESGLVDSSDETQRGGR